MAFQAQRTNIAVWICVVIPFAMIIAASMTGSLVYCARRRKKTTNKTQTRRDEDVERTAQALPTAGVARVGSRRMSASGDGEGLNELGEAPPPYGSARKEDTAVERVVGVSGENETGQRAEEGRPPAYDAVVDLASSNDRHLPLTKKYA
ncbi:hypothetical protein M406DRAFT_334143 [Cryphonectria parasitica EP155]|uniref:Transmembrane protein n=1 Tax=Cryphonectria parasitica (strain ATCC 38755 / EP155) TaxID=660469 RepID=A0A9P4XTI5_CRYP1|nr:uncharacterized protein M406DRAFT_334143 [Cryphonectria parasitica EP155]KAF3760510.1 hypothetical protein M406DRAFT_334143 [Cryphonectria parasitica EP155]